MSGSTAARGELGRWALNVYAALGLVYLFTPILFIVLFSFNQPRGNFNIEWQQFTLDNWKEPFADRALTDALWLSLKIATISTVVSTLLGSLIAIALSRHQFKGVGPFNLLLVLPVTTPEIVLGSSLATLFLSQDILDFGLTTIVIAHIMFQLSFVALVVRARIRGFDWTLEQAAQDLGAPPFLTFWKVTFPLILPGILSAALLAFALSICPASAGNGGQRSAVKLTEGTYDKSTKAIHRRTEGRHSEAAFGGQGAGLEALRRAGAAADGVLPLAERIL